jgi:hypothetical protein
VSGKLLLDFQGNLVGKINPIKILKKLSKSSIKFKNVLRKNVSLLTGPHSTKVLEYLIIQKSTNNQNFSRLLKNLVYLNIRKQQKS